MLSAVAAGRVCAWRAWTQSCGGAAGACRGTRARCSRRTWRRLSGRPYRPASGRRSGSWDRWCMRPRLSADLVRPRLVACFDAGDLRRGGDCRFCPILRGHSRAVTPRPRRQSAHASNRARLWSDGCQCAASTGLGRGDWVAVRASAASHRTGFGLAGLAHPRPQTHRALIDTYPKVNINPFHTSLASRFPSFSERIIPCAPLLTAYPSTPACASSQ